MGWPRARVLGPQPARSVWGAQRPPRCARRSHPAPPGSAPTPVRAPGFAEDPAEQSPLVPITPLFQRAAPFHPGELPASEAFNNEPKPGGRPDVKLRTVCPQWHLPGAYLAACFLPASVLVFRPQSVLFQVDASTVAVRQRAKCWVIAMVLSMPPKPSGGQGAM